MPARSAMSRSNHDLPPPEFAWMRRRVSTSVGRSDSSFPPSIICPMNIASPCHHIVYRTPPVPFSWRSCLTPAIITSLSVLFSRDEDPRISLTARLALSGD